MESKKDKNVTIKEGVFNGENGIYFEYNSEETKIVVLKDGIEYKQEITEFIDNCTTQPQTNNNQPSGVK